MCYFLILVLVSIWEGGRRLQGDHHWPGCSSGEPRRFLCRCRCAATPFYQPKRSPQELNWPLLPAYLKTYKLAARGRQAVDICTVVSCRTFSVLHRWKTKLSNIYKYDYYDFRRKNINLVDVSRTAVEGLFKQLKHLDHDRKRFNLFTAVLVKNWFTKVPLKCLSFHHSRNRTQDLLVITTLPPPTLIPQIRG